MTLPLSWTYEPYERLSDAEKAAIRNDFLHRFEAFDNDIIVNSVAEVLRENQFTDFIALQVGPEIPGGQFSLDTQFTKESFEHQYLFFAFPANKGRHSVAVVIDNEEKRCYLLDSEIMYYQEVVDQLKQTRLKNYEIVKPSGDAVLFQQDDEWSCGVHSAANIMGIITGDINIETGKGIKSSGSQSGLKGLIAGAIEKTLSRYFGYFTMKTASNLG